MSIERTIGRSVAAAMLAVASAAGAVAAEPEDRAEEILQRAKEASGGAAWDEVVAIATSATVAVSGLSGTVESWEDVATGRYTTRFDLQVAAGAEGFDGEAPWQQDGSGAVTVTESGGDRAAAANQAYYTARGYWYPDRWAAEVTAVRSVDDGGRSFDVVELLPRGGRTAELWFDTETGRLDRVMEAGARQVTTVTYADYREVDGVAIPYSVRSSTGDRAHDTVITVTAVDLAPDVPAGTFALPDGTVDDYELVGGVAATDLPFALYNNHIYVEVSINDAEPRRFLVDTGGMNLLTDAAARELGVESQGSMPVHGVGEEVEEVSIARVDSVQIGAARLADQLFIVMDLDEIIQVEGVRFDGLVGFEMFRRFVVEIDYESRRLRLLSREAFDPSSAGEPVPFRFDDRTPVVDGSIDGVGGVLALDTGSRSSLAIHGPFAAEHDFEARYEPTFEALSGWGVGGGVRSQPVGPVTLRLGDVEIPNVQAEITRQEGGAFTDRYTAANVGGAVFERFTVTFDYDEQVVYFEPNGQFDTPEPYDRAGVWLNRDGDVFVIEDVTPGGPVADAGVRTGDRVLEVDGRPSRDLLLPDVRARLRAAVETEVVLSVESEGEVREVAIVLRELI